MILATSGEFFFPFVPFFPFFLFLLFRSNDTSKFVDSPELLVARG